MRIRRSMIGVMNIHIYTSVRQASLIFSMGAFPCLMHPSSYIMVLVVCDLIDGFVNIL